MTGTPGGGGPILSAGARRTPTPLGPPGLPVQASGAAATFSLATTHRLSLAVDQPSGSAHNHRNWWTWGKAERMLREAGFDDVWLSAYGQSYGPAMRNTMIFDSTHPRISLYVEATR